MSGSCEQIWSAACEKLKARLTPEVYERWIAVIKSKELGETALILSVSNDFYQSWVEENYLSIIEEAVASVLNRTVTVLFEVNPDVPVARESKVVARPKIRPTQSPSPNKGKRPELNEKYTFKNFIIGPTNNFAHASSLAVAQSPGKAYNPLFIYGGVGVGKTHLMQAIGHHSTGKSELNVRYISCETLMNEYITALQQQSTAKFRRRYRTADILLVDDIHFLANKNSLQEELNHTFNEL
ncbi:MAG: ATP-binding protein, partial [Lentisphaerae bacterium]|nr:ATP-binding protein [Lentisphaerota bacterium]